MTFALCETCGCEIRAGRRFCPEDGVVKDAFAVSTGLREELNKKTPAKKKFCQECNTYFSGLGVQCSAPCYESFNRKQAEALKGTPKAPKRGHQQAKKKSKPNKAVVITCPHPWKQVFRTFAEGTAVIEKKHAHDKDTMHAYSCQCGAIHIGHTKKADSSERIEERDKAKAEKVAEANKKRDFSRFPPNMR